MGQLPAEITMTPATTREWQYCLTDWKIVSSSNFSLGPSRERDGRIAFINAASIQRSEWGLAAIINMRPGRLPSCPHAGLGIDILRETVTSE